MLERSKVGKILCRQRLVHEQGVVLPQEELGAPGAFMVYRVCV